MEDQTFTQEQLAQAIEDAKKKWVEKELKPLRDELEKFKPKEKSDVEKELEKKQAELWHKQIVLTLKESKLEDFAPFLEAKDEDELNVKITKLNDVLKSRMVDNAYVPDNHKSVDKYSQFEKNNDVVGMIGAKLEKLFN